MEYVRPFILAVFVLGLMTTQETQGQGVPASVNSIHMMQMESLQQMQNPMFVYPGAASWIHWGPAFRWIARRSEWSVGFQEGGLTYAGLTHTTRISPHFGVSLGGGVFGYQGALLYYFTRHWESTALELHYSAGDYLAFAPKHNLLYSEAIGEEYFYMMHSIGANIQFRLANLTQQTGVNVSLGVNHILPYYIDSEEVYDENENLVDVVERWTPSKLVFNLGVSFCFISRKFRY